MDLLLRFLESPDGRLFAMGVGFPIGFAASLIAGTIKRRIGRPALAAGQRARHNAHAAIAVPSTPIATPEAVGRMLKIEIAPARGSASAAFVRGASRVLDFSHRGVPRISYAPADVVARARTLLDEVRREPNIVSERDRPSWVVPRPVEGRLAS